MGSCDTSSVHNHPHLDDNDIISMFVTLGDDTVIVGRTLYFDGGDSSFKKSDPYLTYGNPFMCTKFYHG